MTVKELKEHIKNLPDDADIVMQKRITDKWTMVAPVLKIKVSKVLDGSAWKERILMSNLKPLKKMGK